MQNAQGLQSVMDQAGTSGSTVSWPSLARPRSSLLSLWSGSIGSIMYTRTNAAISNPVAIAMSKAARLSMPAADAPSFRIDVEVTAFEPRYCDAAAATIHDLFLLNFAPKSNPDRPVGPCGISLAADKRTIKVDWKKTRFTLTRGPHIDKFGMEQVGA